MHEIDKIKLKKREALFAKLRKDYKDDSVIKKLSETVKVDVVSTWSVMLDSATWIGWFPRGRIIEIAGLNASGKTTIALSAIREVQKKWGLCLIVDAEQALNKEWAEKIWVDLDNLDIMATNCLEDVFDQLALILQEDIYDLILVDSLWALSPRSELDGDMDAMSMALKARQNNKWFKKIIWPANKSKCSVIFINHVYNSMNQFNPWVSWGWEWMKYYSSMRLMVTKIGSKHILAWDVSSNPELLKDKDQIVGTPVRIEIVKNKVGSPGIKFDTRIIHTRPIFMNGEEDEKVQLGFNKYSELFDACFQRWIIEQITPRKYIVKSSILWTEEDIEWTFNQIVDQFLNDEELFTKLEDVYKESFQKEFKEKLKASKMEDEWEKLPDENQIMFAKFEHYEVIEKKRKNYQFDQENFNDLVDAFKNPLKLDYNDMFEYIFDEKNAWVYQRMLDLLIEREASGEYDEFDESSVKA